MSSASRVSPRRRLARFARFDGLWHHPDFLKLWTGQTVSVFGTLITKVALPIAAVVQLHATPAQVALIYAAQVAPTLALGLLAGVLVDRVRRRPLLIAADVGRALALLAVPVAAGMGQLGLPLIYAVTLLTSALSGVFDIAYPAYLPTLVGEERLLEGNAKLSASMSVAEVGGFGLSGILVQALSASGAILIDVATYVVSVVSLVLIRAPEPHPTRASDTSTSAPSRTHARDVLREIGEGLRLTWQSPTRRALAGAGAVDALCGNMLETVLLIYILRDLRISPGVMGLTFAVGGVTSFLGATIAQRLTSRLGVRRSLRVSAWASRAGALLIPLASGPYWLALTCLCAAQFGDAARTVADITGTTLLQRVTPSGALGRVGASATVLASVATVVGLALGAGLGDAIGARGTLFLATGGMLLGPLWLTLEAIADMPKAVVAPEGEHLAVGVQTSPASES